ncbi:serine acetyltransferase [Micractinium conductrix]|uniref:serine O-acetyltransferase n=1 Tax=Micractinium conductrix TaxID=554055 RepID=A0A2P6VL79_9CHLO|nr:serine acetyltransferase [Micractinium conductrix]|eukprot:PSC74834.1 serine acetyltransferase [Micractinium conductrix]
MDEPWEALRLTGMEQQGGNIIAFSEVYERCLVPALPPPLGLGTSIVWLVIRREARRDAAAEPLLSSQLHACVLSHDTFSHSLAFLLAKRLASTCLNATELFDVFCKVLDNTPHVVEAALADIRAVFQRDPSCISYSQALMYLKGYHAVQSRMSEVFATDIHPGARFGKGILLDHGTGVVIGETAVVGDNVSILQNVTLGGTGKEDGDRHPKIMDHVLIGACARILGNIEVGHNAQVAAGSTVLRPVPPHTLVAGAPAREIGGITGRPAQDMDHGEATSGKRAARWNWFGGVVPPEYLI